MQRVLHTAVKRPHSSMRRARARRAQPMIQPFGRLPRHRLGRMAKAAVELMTCYRELADRGENPLTALFQGARQVAEWEHYPAKDVFDSSSESQYYYHSHAAQERLPGEHGHFHLFMRPGGSSEGERDGFVHVVGISVDARGMPLCLFTTNRWVTGEAWRPALGVAAMIDRFAIGIDAHSAHIHPWCNPWFNPWVNRWLGAMLQLYRPQIEALLAARDERIEQARAERSGADVLEDRSLYVLSEQPVSLDAQVAAVEAALEGMHAARARAGARKGAPTSISS